jgi:hypothetical protein
MAKNTRILQELQGIAPRLAAQNVGLPFAIPEDYFSQFPEKMLEKALNQPGKQEVPPGYFDAFAGNMLGRVRKMEVEKELKEVAPLLNSISKSMPHYLPEGYFSRDIPIPAIEKPAKVVPMFGSTVRSWAVAASVIAVLSLGWIFMNRQNASTDQYTTFTTEEINTMLGKMDETRLDKLVEESAVETEFTELLLLAGQDVENSLQDLSTDELKFYLENHKMPEKGI